MSKTKQTATESPKLGTLPTRASGGVGQALALNSDKSGYEHIDIETAPFPVTTSQFVGVGSAMADDFATVQEAWDWVIENFYPAGGEVLIRINDTSGLVGGLDVNSGDWPWIRITTDGLLTGNPGAVAFSFYNCGSPYLDFVEVDVRPGTEVVIDAVLSTVRLRQDCTFIADDDAIRIEAGHLEISDDGTGSNISAFSDNPTRASVWLRNSSVKYLGASGLFDISGGLRISGAGQGYLADFGAMNLDIDRYVGSASFTARALYIQGGSMRCGHLEVRNVEGANSNIPMAMVYPAALDCMSLEVGWVVDVTDGTQNAMTIGQGVDLTIRSGFTATDAGGSITLGDPVELSTPGSEHGGVWKLPSDFNLPAGVSPNSFNSGDLLVVGGV